MDWHRKTKTGTKASHRPQINKGVLARVIPSCSKNKNTHKKKSDLPNIYILFCTLLLSSSFWTSRGHRCRPFSPPGSCLQFFLSRIGFSIFHCSSIFHRLLLTHALALSASQFVHKKKSQRIYMSMYALGGARTHETDLYQARG